MRAAREIALFALLTTAPAFAGPPATTQHATAEEEQRAILAQESAEAMKLPPIRVKSPADLVRISTSVGMLVAELAQKNLPDESHVIVPEKDIVATLRTFKLNVVGADDNSQRFSLTLRDFSQGPTTSAYTTVSAVEGRVQISRDFESPIVAGSIQLIQDSPPLPGQAMNPGGPVRLLVQRTVLATQKTDLDIHLAAGSFVELCRQHPAEVDEYLRPILRELGQDDAQSAPDLKAAWQALVDDVNPDNTTTAKVKAILARLNSDNFRDRQSAATDLDTMGEPAAVVLMRLDRSGMTAEQTSGVDTFLSPYLPMTPDEAKRQGHDVAFLLNCQYLDDAPLRRLAAARLSSVLHQPSPVDPDSTTPTRASAIAKARVVLLPPTTTQRSGDTPATNP